MRVLLIWDQADSVESLKNLLSQDNSNTVCVVDSLFKAENKIRAIQFDVVLLNLSLADTDLTWMVKWIRSTSLKMPIVLLSANEPEVYRFLALKNGAIKCISINEILTTKNLIQQEIRDSIKIWGNQKKVNYGLSQFFDMYSRWKKTYGQ